MNIGGLMTQKLPFKTDPEAFELEIAEPRELGVGDRSTFSKTVTDEDVRTFAEVSGTRTPSISPTSSPRRPASDAGSSTARSSPARSAPRWLRCPA